MTWDPYDSSIDLLSFQGFNDSMLFFKHLVSTISQIADKLSVMMTVFFFRMSVVWRNCRAELIAS